MTCDISRALQVVGDVPRGQGGEVGEGEREGGGGVEDDMGYGWVHVTELELPVALVGRGGVTCDV